MRFACYISNRSSGEDDVELALRSPVQQPLAEKSRRFSIGEKQCQPTEELKHGRIEEIENEQILEPRGEHTRGFISKTTRGYELSEELKKGSRLYRPWHE